MLWLVAVVIAAGAIGTAFAVTAIGEPPVLPERPIGGVLIVSAIIFVAGTVGPDDGATPRGRPAILGRSTCVSCT